MSTRPTVTITQKAASAKEAPRADMLRCPLRYKGAQLPFSVSRIP
jgi:hypothetical protein